MKKYSFALALLVLLSGCSAIQDKQDPSSVSAASSLVSSEDSNVSSEAAQEAAPVSHAQFRGDVMHTSAIISKMNQIVTDAFIRLGQPLPIQQVAVQEAPIPVEPAVSTELPEQTSAQIEQPPTNQQAPAEQTPSSQKPSAPEEDITPSLPTADTQSEDVLEEPVQKPKTTISSTNFLSKVEDQVLALINEERANQGLSPLVSDPDLKTAARIRSKELYKSGTFAHQRPNGDEWSTVITQDVPVKFIAAGENLCTTTYNDPNLNSAYDAQFWFDRWYNSPEHYENMVRPNFTHIGVGIYCMEKDGFIYAYATTIFAEF